MVAVGAFAQKADAPQKQHRLREARQHRAHHRHNGEGAPLVQLAFQDIRTPFGLFGGDDPPPQKAAGQALRKAFHGVFTPIRTKIKIP